MAARSRLIATLLLALALLALAACGGSGGGSSSGGSGGGGTTCTGSLAWCAPVGAAVQGATLADGWADLRVLPSPVNVNGGWTDSVAVTPDGLHLYFGYTRFDFTTFFREINGYPEGDPPQAVFDPTGPARPGMTGDTFQIFRADLSASGWSVEYWPENDPAKMYAAASVNEAQDLMVFSDFVGESAIAELHYSALSGETWSTPVRLPFYSASPAPGEVGINAGCASGDDNGFVIGDLAAEATLYWESHRSEDDGSACGTERHLYQSTFTAGSPGTWSDIIPVPGLNDFTPGDESDDSQVSFSPDGKFAYWTSLRTHEGSPTYSLFTATRNGIMGVYENPHPIVTPTFASPFTNRLVIMGEINVAEVPEGRIAYFMCGIAQTDDPHEQVALRVCRMKQPRVPINTALGWSDSPSISRDGQRLYFMYSRYNFATWIMGGDPEDIPASGPYRPGLRTSDTNPFDESDIYVATKLSNGKWGEPVSLGFNGAYGDSSGMEFDDGDGFVWLRGDGATNDIVLSTRNPDGTWTAPTVLGNGINSGSTEDNPHISSDGTRLYFVSDRGGGVGAKDLYFSEFTTGWSAPVNLGSPVNTTADEDQPWVSEAGTEAYWNSGSYVMHCETDETGCITTPQIVDLPGCRVSEGKFAAEVTLPDDGQTLYFACGTVATGRVRIMYATKNSGGGWNQAKPVD